jgi:hypothetical protein
MSFLHTFAIPQLKRLGEDIHNMVLLVRCSPLLGTFSNYYLLMEKTVKIITFDTNVHAITERPFTYAFNVVKELPLFKQESAAEE